MRKAQGPKEVIRDYKNINGLRKRLKSAKRAAASAAKQIADLEWRLDYWRAGGVTEVYEGFPLRITKPHPAAIEVWQCYEASAGDSRLATLYKMCNTKGRECWGLNYKILGVRGTDGCVMYLSKNDAIEQGKRWVVYGEIPPKDRGRGF